MRHLLAEATPEVVYHLAAQVSVTRSVRETEYDADVNVLGTAAMLEAARLAGVKRFVYISTGGALYGATDRIPTPEDSPILPESPYGQSKWAAESTATSTSGSTASRLSPCAWATSTALARTPTARRVWSRYSPAG